MAAPRWREWRCSVDESRFDAWTRLLGTYRSRRTTLRAVAAGALATALAARGGEEAAAKCVDPGKKCKSKHGKKKKCCGGAKCQGSKCKCPDGLLACGGLCVDALNDLQHCGQCDKACGATETCYYGHCCVEDGPKGPHNLCCTGFVCNPPGQNCICA